MTGTRQPTLYIPHGGGPCFFMDDPRGIWTGMEAFLRELPTILPEPPTAILLISGHWETPGGFAFTSGETPSLLFDYYNFPPHTYQLRYDAPGAPELAARARQLLEAAGFPATLDGDRGFDHGVFIPMKVAWPEADVPIVEMSLDRSLDPELHLAVGRALAPLRDEGVLIIGAGMSFHNLRAFGDPRITASSEAFDHWLVDAVESVPTERATKLSAWADAPGGRLAHPREEHLLPLMVAAGASDGAGQRIYAGTLMEAAVSGFRFD